MSNYAAGESSSFADLGRPPLDPESLRSALVGPGTWWREVIVFAESPSTNSELADRARAGAPEGTLVTTDHQVAGRGRLDRPWQSPARSGLAVSVLLRPDLVPAERWSWLPLVVGLAAAETVRKSGGLDAMLKWPNDVMIGDRKLAGILVERVETGTGPGAVVGLGLNVSLRREELPVPHATSLVLENASTIDRSVLLRAYARNLEALYRAWAAREGAPYAGVHESYVRRCVTVGQQVVVTGSDGSTARGLAEAIDGSGRLVVDVAGDRQAFSAGDITHVRPQS